MSAAVIKFPAPEVPAQPTKPKSGGYTNLDNDTDLTVLAELPNALVKPALFLMSRRGLRQPAAHWGEVAAFCKRSQTQTSEALKALADLGYAVSEGGLWRWENRVSPGNPPETPRKPGMAAPKNAVLHGEKPTPELRNEGTKEMNNNIPVKEPGYGDALRAVDAAGLLGLWQKWVALQGIRKPTQESQIQLWATWVQEGRADALRAEAQNIIDLGSYAHPFAGLKKRMALGAGNAGAQGSETGSGPARPALRPGQRVRYPDGSEATVVAVLSRGVATDHPDFPDVPLGQVKTLTVLE